MSKENPAINQTTFVYPPIPVRSFDWFCCDDDNYDADWDGEGYVSTSPRGEGETEEEAIIDWFLNYLEDEGISVSEIMALEGESVQQVQHRAEVTS